jgi:hypothetical protein
MPISVTATTTMTNPHHGVPESAHASGTVTAVPQVPGAIGE